MNLAHIQLLFLFFSPSLVKSFALVYQALAEKHWCKILHEDSVLVSIVLQHCVCPVVSPTKSVIVAVALGLYRLLLSFLN